MFSRAVAAFGFAVAVKAICSGLDCEVEDASLLVKRVAKEKTALSWCLLGYKCAPMQWLDCPLSYKGLLIPCFPCFYDLGNTCDNDAALEDIQKTANQSELPDFAGIINESWDSIADQLYNESLLESRAIQEHRDNLEADHRDNSEVDPELTHGPLVVGTDTTDQCVLGYACLVQGSFAPFNVECPQQVGNFFLPCLPCTYYFGGLCGVFGWNLP